MYYFETTQNVNLSQTRHLGLRGTVIDDEERLGNDNNKRIKDLILFKLLVHLRLIEKHVLRLNTSN